MTGAYAFSFVFPFFLLVALIQWVFHFVGKEATGWIPKLFTVLLSGTVVLFPVDGLPLGRWLISLFPNPSIPLTALLFSWVFKCFFQVQLLDKRAVLTCRLLSLMAGATLYPMALGIGSFDPYSAGWHFSWLFVSLLAVTLGLLFVKNRFFFVFLATILAYDLRLLESANLWDYLLDPILVLVSFGALMAQIIRRGVGILLKSPSRSSK